MSSTSTNSSQKNDDQIKLRSRSIAKPLPGHLEHHIDSGQDHLLDTETPERYSQLDQAQKYHDKVTSKNLWRRVSQHLELGAVERALAYTHGGKVLDTPCGTGRIDSLLRDHFSEIVGLDISEPMLAVYRAGEVGRVGIHGSIFDMPFQDKEFDWVISHRLFHHFQTDKTRIKFLENMKRVAREGVIFYAWMDAPFSKRRGSRRFSLPQAQVEQIIEKAGLELVSIHWASWPLQPKAVLVTRVPG